MPKNVNSTSLATAGNSAALEAVLQYQKALSAAQHEVHRIELAMQSKKDAAAQLQREVPDLTELDTARETMLARVAIGEATQDDLAALDAAQEASRVDAMKLKVKADLSERESSQALAGLAKLLDAARLHLASLEAQQGPLVGKLIQEARNEVYGEYLQAAAAVRDAWLRLLGLARLDGDDRHVSQFYGVASNDLELPKLRHVEAAAPEISPRLKGDHLNFDSSFYSFEIYKRWHPDCHVRQARCEADILREKGVTLKLDY